MSDSTYNEGRAKRSRASTEWDSNPLSRVNPQALGDQTDFPVRPLETSGEVSSFTVSKNEKTRLSVPGYCISFVCSQSVLRSDVISEYRPPQQSTFERVSYVS